VDINDRTLVRKINTASGVLVKRDVLVAGTWGRILAELLHQPGDNDLLRDTLYTYRLLLTPNALLDELLKSVAADPTPAVEAQFMRILACWTLSKPLCFDPKLASHPDVLVAILHAANKYPDSTLYATVRENLAALKPPVDRMVISPPDPNKYRLRVQITKPGDVHDAFECKCNPATTLAEVLREVALVSRRRQEEADKGATTTDSVKVLDPTTFQFLAVGFGSPLPLSLNVMEKGLQVVKLVPLKAYTTSSCTADYIDPEIVAYLITILDQRMFSSVDFAELLCNAWQSSPREALHVSDLTTRFNKFVDWAIEAILKEKSVTERARVLEKIIKIGDYCYSWRNYHGVFQVISALKSAPIMRLKRTWAAVNHISMNIYTCIEKLMRPQNNRVAYRSKLDQVPSAPYDADLALHARHNLQPCLPYLGIFLSDFLFAEEGQRDYVNSAFARSINAEACSPEDNIDLVNFSKLRRIGRLIHHFHMFQTKDFDLSMVAEEKSLLFTRWLLDSFPAKIQEDLYSLSMKQEPSNNQETDNELISKIYKIGNFEFRTAYDTAPTESDEALSPTSVDEWARRHKGIPKPLLCYLGCIVVPTIGEIDAHVEKYAQPKKVRSAIVCSFDIRSDCVNVIEASTKNIMLKPKVDAIEFYRFDEVKSLLYFALDDRGRILTHIFGTKQDDNKNHSIEEVFMQLHRAIDRCSKTSLKASELVWACAFSSLMDTSLNLPNGVFVLRDSLTRVGHFALTLKHAFPDGHSDVTHFLIESVDGGVRFKDSDSIFPTLIDLITHYCIQPFGLPCRLVLEGSHFLTSNCPRPASNVVDQYVTAHQTRAHILDVHYYYPHLLRDDAEKALHAAGDVPGMYLIRASSASGHFALTFVWQGRYVHALIAKVPGGYSVNEHFCGPNIDDVIRLYSTPNEASQISLTQVCPREFLPYEKVDFVSIPASTPMSSSLPRDSEYVMPYTAQQGEMMRSLSAKSKQARLANAVITARLAQASPIPSPFPTSSLMPPATETARTIDSGNYVHFPVQASPSFMIPAQSASSAPPNSMCAEATASSAVASTSPVPNSNSNLMATPADFEHMAM
jgi:hypothetical protein